MLLFPRMILFACNYYTSCPKQRKIPSDLGRRGFCPHFLFPAIHYPLFTIHFYLKHGCLFPLLCNSRRRRFRHFRERKLRFLYLRALRSFVFAHRAEENNPSGDKHDKDERSPQKSFLAEHASHCGGLALLSAFI